MADGGTSKKQQAAAPEDGVTALFRFGQEGQRAKGRPEGMGAGLAACRERSAATVCGAGGEPGEDGRAI